METILAGLMGGLFRLAPEVLKLLDRKNERQHESSMFDKQLEADKLRGQQHQAEIDGQIGLAEVGALIEATKAQGIRSGIKWVDALSSLVRPILAFQWLIFLWPAVIAAGFWLAVQAGANPLVAMREAFGVDEKAMAFSIASFWLVDRSLRRK